MSRVKNMQVQINEAYVKNYFLKGTYNLSPLLNFAIEKNDGKYTLLMKVEINNTADKPFPIDLKVIISGTFDFLEPNEEEINEFMKKEAIQMLYPYLRSYVSNLTANSMMSPIMLPIIDVRNIKIEEDAL